MKPRDSLYNDSNIELIREDDRYVLVNKEKNVKVVLEFPKWKIIPDSAYSNRR